MIINGPLWNISYISDVTYVFKNQHNDSTIVPAFTIGGGKCEKYKWSSCDWIDYERVGGNCMVEHSSVFLYCSYAGNIHKNKMRDLEGRWSSQGLSMI